MKKTRESISNLFEILWYSQLPCFDVKNITSQTKDEISLMKRCYWKEIEISCSSIFSTRPTDRGMCCSFNMEKADDIFKESQYGEMINKMQKQDRDLGFDVEKEPNWFTINEEPRSRAGRKKGLRVVLDAHSDRVSSGTISDNFRGFVTVVDGKEKYPLTGRDSFTISPGRENYIALSAFQIYAEDDIRSIHPGKRNCYFPDEHPLNMHKHYSQSNCILECSIMYARNHTMDGTTNRTCTPWFYPVTNEFVASACDPWSTKDFQDCFDNIPTQECSHCLPDCTSFMYETRKSTAPFMTCDHTNLGVNRLCDLENEDMTPSMWRRQVQDEYIQGRGNVPSYAKSTSQTMNNIRRFAPESKMNGLILKDYRMKHQKYHAFKTDIAVANFYFDKSTIIKFQRNLRMTWIDYISQIGGLLGLAMGFSFVSFMEVIYWILFRLGMTWAIHDKENSKRYLSKSNSNLKRNQGSPVEGHTTMSKISC